MRRHETDQVRAGGVKVVGVKNPDHQPKGWPLNFRTANVLVDFDGGRQVQQVGDRRVTDDAAQELLIVRPDGKLVEAVELLDHPWFVGVQSHPEFLSKPTEPHPLFRDFVGAALDHRRQREASKGRHLAAV